MPETVLEKRLRIINGHMQRGKSPAHAQWLIQKQNAKAEGLDVSVFDLNLGKALDNLDVICANVAELHKLHGGWSQDPQGNLVLDRETGDQEWKDAIERRVVAVNRILRIYRTRCVQQAKRCEDEGDREQASSWRSLRLYLAQMLAKSAQKLCGHWGFKIDTSPTQ